MRRHGGSLQLRSDAIRGRQACTERAERSRRPAQCHRRAGAPGLLPLARRSCSRPGVPRRSKLEGSRCRNQTFRTGTERSSATARKIEREALRDPYRHRCWQNVRGQEYLDGILQNVMHGQIIRFVLNLNLRSPDPGSLPSPTSPGLSRRRAGVESHSVRSGWSRASGSHGLFEAAGPGERALSTVARRGFAPITCSY